MRDEEPITAEDIKELRDTFGWSQEELAHQMRRSLESRLGPTRGPSLGTVSRWERGAKEPTPIYRAVLRDLIREARKRRAAG